MRANHWAAHILCALAATLVRDTSAFAVEMVVSPGLTAAIPSGAHGEVCYGAEVALLTARSGNPTFLGGVAAVSNHSLSLQLEPVFELGLESGLLAGMNPGINYDWRNRAFGVDIAVWLTPFGWHIASPLFPFARIIFQAGGSSWEVGAMLKIPIFFKL